MKKFVFAGTALLSLAIAVPAQATAVVNGGNVTFNNTDLGNAAANTAVINFNGLGDVPGVPGKSVIPGLSGQLTLTLNSIIGNAFTFSYSMLNNSTAAGTFIGGIGFDVDPNVSGVGVGAGSIFDEASLGGFAASFVSETCFGTGPGNCPQSNPGNAIALGATGTGSLILNFTNPQTSITLSNFLDRYQGFNVNGVQSAVGEGTPVRGGGLPPPGVPEPATWAMMLVGFGAIGAAMRRRSQMAMRFNFA